MHRSSCYRGLMYMLDGFVKSLSVALRFILSHYLVELPGRLARARPGNTGKEAKLSSDLLLSTGSSYTSNYQKHRHL